MFVHEMDQINRFKLAAILNDFLILRYSVTTKKADN